VEPETDLGELAQMIELCIVEGTAKEVEGQVNRLLTERWKLWTAAASIQTITESDPHNLLRDMIVTVLRHAIYLTRHAEDKVTQR